MSELPNEWIEDQSTFSCSKSSVSGSDTRCTGWMYSLMFQNGIFELTSRNEERNSDDIYIFKGKYKKVVGKLLKTPTMCIPSELDLEVTYYEEKHYGSCWQAKSDEEMEDAAKTMKEKARVTIFVKENRMVLHLTGNCFVVKDRKLQVSFSV